MVLAGAKQVNRDTGGIAVIQCAIENTTTCLDANLLTQFNTQCEYRWGKWVRVLSWATLCPVRTPSCDTREAIMLQPSWLLILARSQRALFNNWSRCDCTHIVPRSRSSVDKSLRAGTEGNSAMRSWQSNKQLKIWVPQIIVEVALKKAALLVKSKSVAPLGQIALV